MVIGAQEARIGSQVKWRFQRQNYAISVFRWLAATSKEVALILFSSLDRPPSQGVASRPLHSFSIKHKREGGWPCLSAELLAHIIRFYGHAVQGMLGKYLENNITAFADLQNKMQEQSRTLYSGDSSQMHNDLWAQFLNFQGQAMQKMMSAYMEQSKQMAQQMQEQLQNQTRNILSGFQFPGYEKKDDQ